VAQDRLSRLEPGPQSRQGFRQDIEALIDTKYDGRVSRNFVYEVIAAVRNA
jgi:hypothetical protein